MPTRKISPIKNRRIFLSRHGESVGNVAGRIGGDDDLTDRGKEYARRLCAFIRDARRSRPERDDEVSSKGSPSSERLLVATSMMRRSLQTVEPFKERRSASEDKGGNHVEDKVHYLHTNQLNEINAGVCEGLPRDRVARDYPAELAKRDANKLAYRYPAGESYVDVINRLNPLVVDLERLRHDTLVVSHTACLRALLGYFTGAPSEEVPYLEVPLHCVLEIAPGAFACEVIVHDLFKE